MTTPAPEPSSDPAPEEAVVIALNSLRDALLELSLMMSDYLFVHDSVQRGQVDVEAQEAIHKARTRGANATDGGDMTRHAP